MALSKEIIARLKGTAAKYCLDSGQTLDSAEPRSGGSAAVFRVQTSDLPLALKVYDPGLFEGQRGAAERKRLEIQRKLVGTKSPYLVEVFDIAELDGTYAVVMEYLDWPELKAHLADVPDTAIEDLLAQLVGAIKTLSRLGLVHRDIKPENLLISPSFDKVKLVDYGVVYDGSYVGEEDATDHGNRRPFLATAQYSPPEYLFRLVEPSEALWNGLNIYQTGAVLHDLLNKRAIFSAEMATENRFHLAYSILTSMPTFDDSTCNRFPRLVSLAQRALAKDLQLRVQMIELDDFLPSAAPTMEAAKKRLKQLDVPSERLEEIEGLGGAEYQSGKDALVALLRDIRSHLLSIFDGGLRVTISTTTSPDRTAELSIEGAQGHYALKSYQISVDWQLDSLAKESPIYIEEMSDNGPKRDSIGACYGYNQSSISAVAHNAVEYICAQIAGA